MTAAHEVSAARESISAAEKMQQFRDFQDFDTFEHRSFMPFLRVDNSIHIQTTRRTQPVIIAQF